MHNSLLVQNITVYRHIFMKAQRIIRYTVVMIKRINTTCNDRMHNRSVCAERCWTYHNDRDQDQNNNTSDTRNDLLVLACTKLVQNVRIHSKAINSNTTLDTFMMNEPGLATTCRRTGGVEVRVFRLVRCLRGSTGTPNSLAIIADRTSVNDDVIFIRTSRWTAGKES